jgi:hypothetical protein
MGWWPTAADEVQAASSAQGVYWNILWTSTAGLYKKLETTLSEAKAPQGRLGSQYSRCKYPTVVGSPAKKSKCLLRCQLSTSKRASTVVGRASTDLYMKDSGVEQGRCELCTEDIKSGTARLPSQEVTERLTKHLNSGRSDQKSEEEFYGRAPIRLYTRVRTLHSYCTPLAMPIPTHAWRKAAVATCIQKNLVMCQCFDTPFTVVSCPLLVHACAIPCLRADRILCKDILYQPHTWAF